MIKEAFGYGQWAIPLLFIIGALFFGNMGWNKKKAIDQPKLWKVVSIICILIAIISSIIMYRDAVTERKNSSSITRIHADSGVRFNS